MTTATAISEQLEAWDRGAWCLAAVALAARTDGAPELTSAANQLLSTLGIDTRTSDFGGTPGQVASQAAAPLHIGSALASGADLGWATTSDDALRAQGRASAQGAAMFARFAVPLMGDLAGRLATPGSRILDVGTGIAALAVAYAEAFPQAQVLGIDVLDRALELAAQTIADSPVADRVSVRRQDIAEFADDAMYDLAWVPAPFIPQTALHAGMPRVVSAVRGGGWLILGHGKFGTDPIADALNHLKTIAFGGTPLDEASAQRLLREHGLIDVRTLPTPPGAPAITIGQAPGPS